eukprot:CAMPEP_0196574624 /NCGR_PEP_ID=MMETSP1081-20130531/4304_1 /TAXON_ID=36882 /ORGANISM="Pyramimonas amylifera, Strain CCMP720" /LENGTH=320 /DNA_ID=CAMNT_0041892711 /DNA_START=360 /DNA_END=1322 /DNA_ORIENTATION=-
MIITHGYYYDRIHGAPSWRDDTWAFSLTSPHKWRNIVPLGKGGSGAPHGRYGHVVALHGSDLYLHGGTDGGTRIHGEHGFQMSMEFDDLWRLSLLDQTWELMQPGEAGHPYGPGKRYLHSAVTVGDDIWFYAGSNRSDLWGWNTLQNIWHQVIPHPDRPWPGSRQGHKAAALPERQGFVVSGGTRWGFGGRALLDDLWVYKPKLNLWEQLHVRQPSPVPRLYHSVATLNGRMILSGGSSNSPGMVCEDETWIYSPLHSQWTQLPSAPIKVYHHTIVTHEPTQTVFMFGGHLCGPDSPERHAYMNGVYKLKIPAENSDQDL